MTDLFRVKVWLTELSLFSDVLTDWLRFISAERKEGVASTATMSKRGVLLRQYTNYSKKLSNTLNATNNRYRQQIGRIISL